MGDYISQGFTFMNANFGYLIAFILMALVLSIFVQIIPLVGLLAGLVLTPVLQVGLSQFIYAVKTGQRADMNEFFKGFNKVGPIVSTYLLSAFITFLAVLPGLILWYQAGMMDWYTDLMEEYPFVSELPELGENVDLGLFYAGTFLMIAGALVAGSLFYWALNIIWFYETSPMDALNASRKLIMRNWLSFVLFLIVCGLIAGAGVLLCGIGALYTAPAAACAQFFAFSDQTRLFEGNNDQSDIIDHFIA